MRIFDSHVHAMWDDADKAGSFLGTLDEAGYEGAIVFSPICEWHEKGASPQSQKESIDFIAEFAAADRDRIIPFAHIIPQVKGAPDAVRRAKDKGCVGLKMLTNHWYPYDEEVAFPVYEAAQEAELPILFHSGILFAFEDSSRFARPVYFEALMHFPKVRFALAHIAWPWTDECIATWGRMHAHVRRDKAPHQMFIDCTPGTPRFYRSEAIDKAVRYCSCDWLIFGTDSRVSTPADGFRRHLCRDREILQGELRLPESEQAKFFALNLFKFVGIGG